MTDLNDLFVRARVSGPEPSAALMARVLADASNAQQEMLAPKTSALPARRLPQLLDRFMAVFGGAATVSGGVMAGFTGLALGYLQPESLNSLSAILATESTAEVSVDLLPNYDSLLSEE